MRIHSIRPELSLLLAILASSAWTQAAAQEWYVQPYIAAGGEYNDNYRLNRESEFELDGWGATLDLGGTVGFIGQTGEMSLRGTLETGKWEDDEVDRIQTDDYYVRMISEKRFERARLRFRPRYSRESVIKSEQPDVDQVDFENPIEAGGETGLILLKNRRDKYVIPLDYAFDITEIGQIQLGGDYTDVSFDESETLAQRDFTEYGGYLGYRQDITEIDSVTIRGTYSRYEPDTDPDLNTDTYELTATWERRFTDLWRASITAGMYLTNYDVLVGGIVEDDYDTRPALNIGLIRQMERTRLRLNLGNEVRGTSRGELTDRIRGELFLDHELAPRWTGRITALAFREEPVESQSDRGDRTYLRTRVGVAWQWTRTLSLAAAYVFTYQEFDELSGDAKSNGFTAQIRYEGLGPQTR